MHENHNLVPAAAQKSGLCKQETVIVIGVSQMNVAKSLMKLNSGQGPASCVWQLCHMLLSMQRAWCVMSKHLAGMVSAACSADCVSVPGLEPGLGF